MGRRKIKEPRRAGARFPRMTEPQKQPHAKGAKSGVKDGEGAPSPQKGGKRPVEEEDVFGGVERTRNERVRSPDAKP